MPKAIMAVWSDPSDPSREDEYNQWYDSTHVPDVLKVPGFKSATRYKVADVQFGEVDAPGRYIALYEVEVDDLNDIPQGMMNAFAADELPMSDSITPGPITIFEQVSDRIS
jgi:hypothetical protein